MMSGFVRWKELVFPMSVFSISGIGPSSTTVYSKGGGKGEAMGLSPT